MFGIDPDSRLGQALNMIADSMLLSVLWLMCCIPVITFGAATTALYGTVMASYQNRGSVFKNFFRIFRQNFGQSLGAALLFFGVGAVVAADLWVLSKADIPIAGFLKIVLYGVIFLAAIAISYLFPLIARYTGGLKQHIKNSVLLCFSTPATTAIFLAELLLPLLLLLFVPRFFFRALPLFLLLYPGGAAHLNGWLLLRLFERIQPTQSIPEETEQTVEARHNDR